MKSITILLAVIICITSCNSSQVSGHSSDQTMDMKNLEVIKKKDKSIDSLKNILSGIVSTSYDLKVKTLKSLPEFKDATFLSSLETKEYLEILSKYKEKFKTAKVVDEFEDNTWTSVDDSTLIKPGGCSRLKIVFDTTQTITPIAWVEDESFYYQKHKVTKEVTSGANTLFTFNFFYLPKQSVGYIQATFRGSLGTVTTSNIRWFDECIRGLR
jgi:hypothetical protein